MPHIITKIKESAETQYEYYITSIQVEELSGIPDDNKEKRITNLLMLSDIRAKLIPISVFVEGKARWGYARLGIGEVYHKIADTAVYEGCTLITEDTDLHSRMARNGHDVMFLLEFINTITNSSN